MNGPCRLLSAAVLLVVATGAVAQERARQCQAAVASRLNVAPAEVQTASGPRLPTGNTLINWNAHAGGDEMHGYCEVNLSGRVTNFQVGDYTGPSAAGANNSLAATQAAGDFEQACRTQAAGRLGESPDNLSTELGGSVSERTRVNWKTASGRRGFCVLDRSLNMAEFREEGKGSTATFNAGHYNDNPYYDPYRNDPYYNGGAYNGYNGGALTNLRVRADTSGRGSFSGLGQTVTVTRGWVDTTSGRPNIRLSGEGNFRIDLYGDVTRNNGGHDFTLHITSTDRGNANGTASVRLNGDRNEVESISLSGRLYNGAAFSGSFSR